MWIATWTRCPWVVMTFTTWWKKHLKASNIWYLYPLRRSHHVIALQSSHITVWVHAVPPSKEIEWQFHRGAPEKAETDTSRSRPLNIDQGQGSYLKFLYRIIEKAHPEEMLVYSTRLSTLIQRNVRTPTKESRNRWVIYSLPQQLTHVKYSTN